MPGRSGTMIRMPSSVAIAASKIKAPSTRELGVP